MHLVEPVQHVLGVNSNGKEDTFLFIPISTVLKVQLEKLDIFYSFQRSSEKASSEDFSDGKIFQGQPFFGDPNVVRLHLYTDEFEVVNPLGSKRTVHKLTAFYFTIGNLEPNYKSQLRHIHLCILVRHQHLKRYDFKEILHPLIQDLRKLYTDGLLVSVNGQEINLCLSVP